MGTPDAPHNGSIKPYVAGALVVVACVAGAFYWHSKVTPAPPSGPIPAGLPPPPSSVASVPKDYRAKLIDANALFDAGKYQEALTALHEMEPLDEGGFMLRGWSALRVNDIPAARDSFQAAVKLNDHNLDAYSGIGYCALRDGELDAAEKRFRGVLRQQDTNATAIEGLGYVYYRQGKFKKAKPYLEHTLKINPNNQEAAAALDRVKAAAAQQAD